MSSEPFPPKSSQPTVLQTFLWGYRNQPPLLTPRILLPALPPAIRTKFQQTFRPTSPKTFCLRISDNSRARSPKTLRLILFRTCPHPRGTTFPLTIPATVRLMFSRILSTTYPANLPTRHCQKEIGHHTAPNFITLEQFCCSMSSAQSARRGVNSCGGGSN